MRLPAINPRQIECENSRQWHEQVYAAFLEGTPIEVPVTPETYQATQLRISSNTHSFWYKRGFRIRTKTNPDRTVLTVWLEQAPKRPTYKSQPQGEAAWAQPA